jgi:DNA-binding MarR family transcriptional regulator
MFTSWGGGPGLLTLMGGHRMTDQTPAPALPPVGALLRRPEVAVRHEVLSDLRNAGFDDILPAHLGVFQHPGPDGQYPGVIAQRTCASKQAMNHLLHQLETSGYLSRKTAPTSVSDHRRRVITLTERGRAAQATITGTMSRLDRDWHQALGPEAFENLARALERLNGANEVANAEGVSRRAS